MPSILELFAHIGLKADTSQANTFLKGINGIKTELVGAIAGTLSLATAIKAVNAAMEDARQLKQFAAQTGASTTELQRWRSVADQVSGSGGAVADAIKAIVSNQEKIKLGQGNISGYQLLGIDPRQDPFVVMKQIADKTRNLSAGMRTNIMAQFGVSSELTATLDLTNQQFDAMARRAWAIPPSMIDGMNRARASMEQVKNAVMYFTAELATKLGPTIEKVSHFLIEFVRFLAQGIVNIDRLVRNTIGWRTALIALVAILAAMNAEFLLSPIGLFTAAILLLMAILQDLAVYNSGKGRSLFGVLMKGLGMSPEMNKLLGFFNDLRAALNFIGSGHDQAMDNLLNKWGLWGMIVEQIVLGLHDVGDLLQGIFTGNFNGLLKDVGLDKSGIAGGIADMKAEFGGVHDVKSFLAMMKFQMSDAFLKQHFANPGDVAKWMQTPTGQAAAAASGYTINVYSDSDPDAIGRSVGHALQRTVTTTSGQGFKAGRDASSPPPPPPPPQMDQAAFDMGD